MKKLFLIASTIITILVFSGCNSDEEATTIIEDNKSFKELKAQSNKNYSFKTTDGNTIEFKVENDVLTSKQLNGKYVMLNFWATWCAPCIREFYEIPSKILDSFEDENFIFLPIAIGQNPQEVKDKMMYLKERGIEFNVGVDSSKKIWNKYAKGSIPKNIIIDKDGVVSYLSTGNSGKSIDILTTKIKALIKK